MKIIYGKGSCEIDGSIEPIESIVIKYRGNIVIRHGFAELYNIIENNLYFRNLKSKSLYPPDLLPTFWLFSGNW